MEEVRRCVQAGSQAVRFQDIGGHGTGGTFPVGTGYLEGQWLRSCHPFNERAHPLQTRALTESREIGEEFLYTHDGEPYRVVWSPPTK